MKRILPALVASVLVLLGSWGVATAATSVFQTFQGGTGTSSPSGILYGDNGATTHLNTVGIGTGLLFSGGAISNTGVTSLVAGTNITLSGSTGAVTVNATGGSSFGYPFPLAGNATSTLTNFLGGLGATTVQATSTATSTLANQDGVVVATAFLGADLGAQETAAYAALPSDGGTIKIPAGFFTMSTQFNAATNGKFVSIICDPAGTYITWTGAATSTILNTGQGSGSAGQSVSNCHYAGTATSTGQVAFQIGGSNGLKNFSFDGVEVRNFGKAFGSEANSYLYTFDNDFVHGNGQDFSYESSSNAGENIRFFGGTWADCTLAVGNAASNCIDFGTFGASDVTFNSVSFDDAQVHLGAGTRSATFIGGHFENPWADTEPAYTPLLVDNSAFTNVTINGTIFTNGANTQRPVQDISNGGNVTVVSATTEDYGAGTKGVANFITNTGNGWTKVESISKQDSAYTNLYNSTGGTGTLQYNQEDSGYLGLDVLNPTSILSISASSSPQLTSLLGIASSTGNPLLNVYGGGFVTVGTTTPRFALEVVGANNTTGGNGLNLLDLVNPWTGGSGGGAGSFFQTGVLPIAQGDRLGFQAFGYTTGNANTNSVLIGAFADQAWVNGTNQGSYLDFETTADNSTVRNERMRIAANGNVGIGSTSPFFQLSVGSSNVGTFGLSTTTSGCAQFSAIGQLYSTGTACGSGGGSGTVTNVATDATLTGGPISTTGTLGLNLSNANTWNALQTFDQGAKNANGDLLTIEASYIVSTTTTTGNFTDLQSAINALPSTGGTIDVRCGIYTLAATTTIKASNTIINGAGNCTQFNFAAPTVFTAFAFAAPGQTGDQLNNFAIHQTNATFAGIGINASNTPLLAVNNVKIDQTATATQEKDTANDTFYQNWTNLDLRNNNSCVDIGGNPVNDNIWTNVRCALAAGKGGFALYLDSTSVNGAQNDTFINFDSEPVGAATGLTAIYANNAVDDTFIRPYIEGNAKGWNLTANSQRLTFDGGTFVSNTTYTNNGSNNQWLGASKEGVAYNLIQASTTIADVSGNDASVPSLSFIGNNNFAKVAPVLSITLANSTDSGAGIKIVNPGTGPSLYVQSGLSGIGTSTPTAEFVSVAASTTAGTTQNGYKGIVFIIAGLENTVTKLFFEIDQWGHQITSGDTPTVTGGTSSVAGNDNNGTITVTGTALTSVTLNFAHAWPTAPDCTESDNSTALTADITSISATQMVVGFSVGVTSGTVWYQCRSHQ